MIDCLRVGELQDCTQTQFCLQGSYMLYQDGSKGTCAVTCDDSSSFVPAPEQIAVNELARNRPILCRSFTLICSGAGINHVLKWYMG